MPMVRVAWGSREGRCELLFGGRLPGGREKGVPAGSGCRSHQRSLLSFLRVNTLKRAENHTMAKKCVSVYSAFVKEEISERPERQTGFPHQ